MMNLGMCGCCAAPDFQLGLTNPPISNYKFGWAQFDGDADYVDRNHVPSVLRLWLWDATDGFRLDYCYGGLVVEERDGGTVIGLYQCKQEFDPDATASRPSTDTTRWVSVTAMTNHVVYRHDWSRTNKYCPLAVTKGDMIKRGSDFYMATVDMEPGTQTSKTHYDLANFQNRRYADKLTGFPGYRPMAFDQGGITISTYTSLGASVDYPSAGGERYLICAEKTVLTIDGGSTYTKEVQYSILVSDRMGNNPAGYYQGLRYFMGDPSETTAFGVMVWPAIPADAADDNGASDVGTFTYPSTWRGGTPASFAVGDMCTRVISGEADRRLRCVTAYTRDATDPATNGKWQWESAGLVYRNVAYRVPYDSYQCPLALSSPTVDVVSATEQKTTHDVTPNWYGTFNLLEFGAAQFNVTASTDYFARADGKPHGFANFDSLYMGGGSLPSNLVEGRVYDVEVIDAWNFKLKHWNGASYDYANASSDGACYLTHVITWGRYCTADATGNQLYCKSHGITNGQKVTVFDAKGATLPGGITKREYFASVVDADNVQLLLEPHDASVVDITSAGSGILTLQVMYAASSNTTKAVTVEQTFTISDEFTNAEYAQAVAVAAWNGIPVMAAPPGSSVSQPWAAHEAADASVDNLLGGTPDLHCIASGLYAYTMFFRDYDAAASKVIPAGDTCTSYSYHDHFYHAVKFDHRINDFCGISVTLGSTC